MYIQEVVTYFIYVTISYYIKRVTTSWTYTYYVRQNSYSFMYTIIALTFFSLTRYRYMSLCKYFLDRCYFYTVCPGNSDQFYVVTCYIKCVTTSWIHSTILWIKNNREIGQEYIFLAKSVNPLKTCFFSVPQGHREGGGGGDSSSLDFHENLK